MEGKDNGTDRKYLETSFISHVTARLCVSCSITIACVCVLCPSLTLFTHIYLGMIGLILSSPPSLSLHALGIIY